MARKAAPHLQSSVFGTVKFVQNRLFLGDCRLIGSIVETVIRSLPQTGAAQKITGEFDGNY